jgi:hypothetical protein
LILNKVDSNKAYVQYISYFTPEEIRSKPDQSNNWLHLTYFSVETFYIKVEETAEKNELKGIIWSDDTYIGDSCYQGIVKEFDLYIKQLKNGVRTFTFEIDFDIYRVTFNRKYHDMLETSLEKLIKYVIEDTAMFVRVATSKTYEKYVAQGCLRKF